MGVAVGRLVGEGEGAMIAAGGWAQAVQLSAKISVEIRQT
jgi:hypothetical protein